jgi:hypothetical protein
MLTNDKKRENTRAKKAFPANPADVWLLVGLEFGFIVGFFE